MSQTSTFTVPRLYARLGANHGYVIAGDVAQLHADVEFLATPPLSGNWALQLWACDRPHTGGPLVGVKIAEAPLDGDLDISDSAQRLDAETQARVPGGRRDYAMVLVLASGNEGHYTQVHDFANYPARQHFVTPHLDGRVGYRIEDQHIVLEAEAIHSPRAIDNISGSLSLELRAVAEPYAGGAFEGHTLGRADLGRLTGQTSLHAVAERVPFTPPPAGNWEIVLMLREWAGPAGFVTRDFARFAVRYNIEEATPRSDAGNAIAAPAAPRQEPTTESTTASAPPTNRRQPVRVALNRATAEDLAAVKGLNRKVAAEIFKKRPYRSLEELIEVRGIGPKLLDKLRATLTLD